MTSTKSRRRGLAAVGAVAVVMVLGFCIAEYDHDFPWQLRGGVLYDAAVRDYIGRIFDEHVAFIAASLLAFLYQAFLFDYVVGTSPSPARTRTANILAAIGTLASAGIIFFYGAIWMVFIANLGTH